MAVLNHAQRVAANRAAHQSTPAARASNRIAHQSAPPAGYHQVTVPNPLTDPDYMRQHAELTNQRNMYGTQQAHALSQYKATNLQNEQAIGWDPAANHGKGAWQNTVTTPGTYGAAKNDILNDFASRGMAYSTPYATAVENMQNDYRARLRGLATGLNQFKENQGDQSRTYLAGNEAADATARREAVARIAGKFGVQANQVIPGRANNLNVRNP